MNIIIKGNNIQICNSNECWICGEKENLDRHHLLPRHLKPINNVVVSVCKKCHRRLNAEDINGMYSYLYKIKRSVNENIGHIDRAIDILGELKEIKKDTLSGDKEK